MTLLSITTPYGVITPARDGQAATITVTLDADELALIYAPETSAIHARLSGALEELRAEAEWKGLA